ncbi:MAG: N,N'-diacetylchitobiose phosphorylase [Opitutaceae bacterium]
MRYGHFDDKKREYVIERPDTPQSWSNYLGTLEYGAVITNNAGGYSFFQSAAQGRFLRLRFNSIPMDQPGRYFYLRDDGNGDFWSSSWQPVGKPLKRYRSVCRHGTAYTTILSRYNSVETETTYFVPLGQRFEYWRLKVRNRSRKRKTLSIFTYCEFANDWSTTQDLVNLQYTQYIARGSRKGDLLRLTINENLLPDPNDPTSRGQGKELWMGLTGAPITGHDTSRAAFLGPYRSYDRPLVVETGASTGSDAYGDNACGSLRTTIELDPGEETTLVALLGLGPVATVGHETVREYGSAERCEEELVRLRAHWHSRIGSLRVKTPDPEFDHMLNVWNPYNCLITFAWSRAASLVYNGERDGLGFRDTVQDILGVLPLIPDTARERLELMLTGQLANGGAIPVIKPFGHRPGQEAPPPDEEFRSDDCLWFFNTVPAYVAETGDVAFYNKILPFADEGKATVFGHLRRALDFNLTRTGAHGLPCGLSADWNDCLRLGYHGESLFVAFQVRLGLSVYAEIAERLGQEEEAVWACSRREALDALIQEHCWDGEWFIWAIGEDGTIYGTKNREEGQVYLNTQVWSIISGAATEEQSDKAMRALRENLATEYGVMLCAPPFKKIPIEVMRAVLFNPGTKENAGIFNHTQGWVVMAECLRGEGNQAFRTYRSYMPSAYNDRAEIRQSEPYVHCQSTHSKASSQFGVSRVPWLSGTASWSYYSAMHSILGLQPEVDAIRFDPCIPSEWPGFELERIFRGKRLKVEVRNPNKVQKGVRRLTVNGVEFPDGRVPVTKLGKTNRIVVEMG